MLRFLTAGDSHGPALVGIIDGIPAHLKITKDYLNYHLRRRKIGYGRSVRQRIEKDEVRILSGIRFGRTTGGAIGLLIENLDYENWKEIMDFEKRPEGYRPTSVPRPGHGDLEGAIKYGFIEEGDIRDVMEPMSARHTAMIVALCTIVRRLLEEVGAEITSFVCGIGSVNIPRASVAELVQGDWGLIDHTVIDESPLRSPSIEFDKEAQELITEMRRRGDALGGRFVLVASGLSPAIGGYSQGIRRIESRLGRLLFTIPGLKGISIGDAFWRSEKRGSEVQDEIFREEEDPALPGRAGRLCRKTNRAGGIEGGMTTGERLVIECAMKPISTLTKPLRSVDIKTGKVAHATVERSDICVVPSASIIAESLISFALTDALLERFGADDCRSVLERIKEQP